MENRAERCGGREARRLEGQWLAALAARWTMGRAPPRLSNCLCYRVRFSNTTAGSTVCGWDLAASARQPAATLLLANAGRIFHGRCKSETRSTRDSFGAVSAGATPVVYSWHDDVHRHWLVARKLDQRGVAHLQYRRVV